MEATKNILEIELNANLKRRRDGAMSKLDSLSLSENHTLNARQEEIKSIEKSIQMTLKKLQGKFLDLWEFQLVDVDEEIHDCTQQMHEHTAALERSKVFLAFDN